MSRKNPTHYHIYRAINTNHKMYRCMVDGCRHRDVASMMEGRTARCPTCEGNFKIVKDHFRRTNLTCIGCGIAPGLMKTEKNPLKISTGLADLIRKAEQEIAEGITMEDATEGMEYDV